MMMKMIIRTTMRTNMISKGLQATYKFLALFLSLLSSIVFLTYIYMKGLLIANKLTKLPIIIIKVSGYDTEVFIYLPYCIYIIFWVIICLFFTILIIKLLEKLGCKLYKNIDFKYNIIKVFIKAFQLKNILWVIFAIMYGLSVRYIIMSNLASEDLILKHHLEIVASTVIPLKMGKSLLDMSIDENENKTIFDIMPKVIKEYLLDCISRSLGLDKHMLGGEPYKSIYKQDTNSTERPSAFYMANNEGEKNYEVTGKELVKGKQAVKTSPSSVIPSKSSSSAIPPKPLPREIAPKPWPREIAPKPLAPATTSKPLAPETLAAANPAESMPPPTPPITGPLTVYEMERKKELLDIMMASDSSLGNHEEAEKKLNLMISQEYTSLCSTGRDCLETGSGKISKLVQEIRKIDPNYVYDGSIPVRCQPLSGRIADEIIRNGLRLSPEQEKFIRQFARVHGMTFAGWGSTSYWDKCKILHMLSKHK